VASKLLLLGEAPGQDEDRIGRPFVGSAGRILDKLLVEVGLVREAAYVTNTVLCHPPKDRNPSSDEVDGCAAFLDGQLALIQPQVIVTLGAIPLRRLLGRNREVERDHGLPHQLGTAVVVPTFHPAALHWRAGRRDACLRDLRVAKSLLEP
jgi:uracil-DNA glycosylase family 4